MSCCSGGQAWKPSSSTTQYSSSPEVLSTHECLFILLLFCIVLLAIQTVFIHP
jgi:hypothetical protein